MHDQDEELDLLYLARMVAVIFIITSLLIAAVRVLDGPDHRLGTIEIGRTK